MMYQHAELYQQFVNDRDELDKSSGGARGKRRRTVKRSENLTNERSDATVRIYALRVLPNALIYVHRIDVRPFIIAVYTDFMIRNRPPHECSMAPAEADSSLLRIGRGCTKPPR